MNVFTKVIKNISLLRSSTAERPRFFESDVLACYNFAKKFCQKKSVLDIGTGFGFGAEFLLKKGARYVLGIDYDKNTIAIASERKKKNLKFRVLNALELEKIDKKFDVILAFGIIEHLPVGEVDGFLEKVYQHLRVNGVFLLTTPNGARTKFLFGKPYNPYHIKEYTSYELEKMLKKYFSLIEVNGFVCTNQKYKKIQQTIERSIIYKVSYLLGHFMIVRELLAFIPRGLRRRVTNEDRLPKLSKADYKITKKFNDAENLFIIARKKERKEIEA